MTNKEIEEKIQNSITRVFKVVFPNTTNHYDTLFGGTALHLMDEVAFIAATRFCRKKVVTISSSQIDFKKPIPADTIIELIGKVVEVGNTSLKVNVVIYQEDMYDESLRQKSIEGDFTFVAIDDDRKPLKIID